MKRSLALLLALVLLLSGCGTAQPKLSETEIAAINGEETYADGMFSLAQRFSSLEELYESAQLIVRCTVDSCAAVDLDGLPQTHSAVTVREVLKGAAPRKLTVLEEGGVSDQGTVKFGVPLLQEGCDYVLFLVDCGLPQYEDTYCIAGAFQGKFIERDGFYFQQATQSVKLSPAAYTPQTYSGFKAMLKELS